MVVSLWFVMPMPLISSGFAPTIAMASIATASWEDQIQALLGLTEKEKSQILSINMANNPSRFYKEVWIGLGGTQSAVYATEVSAEEYLAYTTEETEKVEVYRLSEQLGGDIEAAIRQLAERRRNRQ